MEENVREIRPNENVQLLSLHDAYQGVIQELIEYTTYLRQGIQARYKQHHMSSDVYDILSALLPKRKTKVIGLRVIKWMDYDIVGPVLIYTIAQQAEEHFRLQRQEDICSLVLSVPNEELPWFALLKILYQANRLVEFIKWLAINDRRQ